MKTKLFISGLVFMAITALAFTQSLDQTPSKQQSTTEKGANFIDANNNGICDNMENNGTNSSTCKGSGTAGCCGQARGQMMGQRMGMGMGMGAGRGMGQKRMGMGMAQGKGMCSNFVKSITAKNAKSR